MEHHPGETKHATSGPDPEGQEPLRKRRRQQSAITRSHSRSQVELTSTRNKYWEYHAKGQWTQFNEEINRALNMCYHESMTGFHTIEIKKQPYLIDFRMFMQRNARTGYERRIRLIVE
jgi:hypothetical protein